MNSETQKGFTLVEIIIYIVVLVGMISSIVAVLVTLSRTENGITSSLAVSESAVSVIERFTHEMHVATSINTSTSTFNVNPGILELNSVDSNNNPRTVDFFVSNGAVHFNQNGVDQGSLTSANVTVTNLTFILTSTTTVAAVHIKLGLQSGTSTAYRSETFYATAALRN